VLNYLFFFLEKIKYGNYIKAIFLIVSLWAYALLTGLSPSVLRAATMFSFIVIGSALKRETNIYNTLAASAFVLLMYDPFIIMQVGFQLSYAAVLGIVYLQPKLYNLFRPFNWLLDKIWAITTVSVAAQLATFPLGMYYFHQFPNYFLLSNLFVIPLATFIINGGILLFMISSISWISTFIAWTVNKLLIFLNLSVAWVEALPHSLSLGISISTLETLLIYSVVFLLTIAFVKKNAMHLQLGFFVFILFMGLQLKEQYDTKQQSYFIVYDVPKQRAIDFVDGNNNYFIATDDLQNNQNKMRFHIMHYRWERRVKKSTLIPDLFQANNYFRNGNFIQFFDQKILLWDENFVKPDNSSIIELDYIIVSEKAKLNLENINCKQVIIDSSVSKYNWEQIKKECHKWGIPFYNVNTQGAFLFEFTSA
jgi:competence protein ComEC